MLLALLLVILLDKEEKFEQLQRFYALWREENAMYNDWAREQG